MKGLQFITVILILNLLLPFCIGSENIADNQAVLSDSSYSEFLSASDAPSGLNNFVLFSNRDSAQEDDRESIEQEQIIPFQVSFTVTHIHFIYPQNTSKPPAVIISRDTPPPRTQA